MAARPVRPRALMLARAVGHVPASRLTAAVVILNDRGSRQRLTARERALRCVAVGELRRRERIAGLAAAIYEGESTE